MTTTPALMDPLFIPLKREFFEDFRKGLKDTEYRIYGPRWNERTCPVGRRVVLSLGYGKAHRLSGVISNFLRSDAPLAWDSWQKCYGKRPKGTMAACIQIEVNR